MQKLGFKANRVDDRHLRLMTWNIKHWGAATNRDCTRDPEERARLKEQRAIHDDERIRNLAEVIYQSRCALVVLQEIAKDAPLGQHKLRIRTNEGLSNLYTFWVSPAARRNIC